MNALGNDAKHYVQQQKLTGLPVIIRVIPSFRTRYLLPNLTTGYSDYLQELFKVKYFEILYK